MAKLVLLSPQTGMAIKSWMLGPRMGIGRHPGQGIQVLDPIVSKAHALVTEKNGRYVLADLGSKNGTYINDVRLNTAAYLAHGDVIGVGDTRLRFSCPDCSSGHLEPSSKRSAPVSSPSVETNIHVRLSRQEEKFLPEWEVADDQALRRDYEKLRIAVELSQALGLERDLDALLDKILSKAFELFPADRGAILTYDEQTGDLQLRKVRRRKDSGNTGVDGIALSQTIVNAVVEERTAVLSSDATLDSRFGGSQSIIFHGIRSAMAVPVLKDDRLLGLIHLDSRLSAGVFGEKDLRLLSGFANQAAVAIENSILVTRMEKEALVRDRLQRLLSPNLVEQVVSGKLEVKKGGEIRRATMLFSDIRGFTAMSEARPPQEIVAILNDYFEVMVDVVFRYEGTLDKFVGDELMAVWGAPVARPDDTVRGVKAALEMMEALKDFNRVMASLRPDFQPLEIGIGINTGDVVSGYMGSSKTMEYTVIGDPVNLGARLCSAAEPGEILISQVAYDACEGAIVAQPLPPLSCKGKRAPVQVYRVLGVASDSAEQSSGDPTEPPWHDPKATTDTVP